jgi:hypothetical protein
MFVLFRGTAGLTQKARFDFRVKRIAGEPTAGVSVFPFPHEK